MSERGDFRSRSVADLSILPSLFASKQDQLEREDTTPKKDTVINLLLHAKAKLLMDKDRLADQYDFVNFDDDFSSHELEDTSSAQREKRNDIRDRVMNDRKHRRVNFKEEATVQPDIGPVYEVYAEN